VVIVNVTRGDLRDELIMADEAFALSPISARATQPREEDYEAISEAFMETSRGRWFLGEYARRNRNADTRMVLDAVARIEENLAAKKETATPAAESGLDEALAAIASAIDEARASALVALESVASEETLAPVRKGARVIREIAWRLREIGADARICDLIDSQVSAIEAACGQVSSAEPKAALSAAFDLIKQRIQAFDDSDKAPGAEDAVASPSPATPEEIPAAAAEPVQPPIPAGDVEPTQIPASADEAIMAAPGAAEVPTETADAHDEALLDMVAFEMAAADPADADELTYAGDPIDIDSDKIHAGPPPAESEMIAASPEVGAPAPQPPPQLSLVESLPEPSLAEPSLAQPSLGASLIANGIVQRRHTSASDPLAAIRRMSQAEKIALFS
jgi:hypothetical protein